jgi:serine/threonine protein kinase
MKKIPLNKEDPKEEEKILNEVKLNHNKNKI